MFIAGPSQPSDDLAFDTVPTAKTATIAVRRNQGNAVQLASGFQQTTASMRAFANLYTTLDATTKTNEKVAALRDYFDNAPPADAAWATYVLSGRKLRQLVPTRLLRQWAAEAAGIPDWLFNESYDAVGDLAETLSLIVPPGTADDDASLTEWIEHRLQPLRGIDEADQRAAVLQLWKTTAGAERLTLMKLITGAFRVGVSAKLVTRAIGLHARIAPEVIAHRLMGDWQPSAGFFNNVIDPDPTDTLISQPYPFCLAHPVASDKPIETLGEIGDYFAEWKWDGIRGQLIRRQDETFLWSRGEDLMAGRWPEIEAAAETLPNGTVLDGEILAGDPDRGVLPFAQLQRRIGRKTIGKKLLREVPVTFHAFDLLEADGHDLRDQSFASRREKLAQLLGERDIPQFVLTTEVAADTWQQLAEIRQQSRDRFAEGLMLKRRDAPYDVGRVRGTWWKWKVDPYTIDAVLIYAQRGSGRRASLYTDYTFALWEGDTLVPFAKAYSGLDDAEIRKVDRFVRQNTKEKFGPVRSVTPELVMELAFEGLQPSTRHKSGIATRFPRILRWRHDKKPPDANTLTELKAMLP